MHPGVEGKLALGSAVDEIIDVALHRADVVLEAQAFFGEARKKEAAIFSHARCPREAERRLVEIGRTPFRHRYGGEAAIRLVAPAVIATGQARGIPRAVIHHLGPAVGAPIKQHMRAAVPMAHHDDRLTPELGRDVIAGLRHLAGMAHEQPGTAEDAFHLQLEDIRVGVDVPMHPSRLDELGDVLCVSVAHGSSSSPIGVFRAVRREALFVEPRPRNWPDASRCTASGTPEPREVTPRPGGRVSARPC